MTVGEVHLTLVFRYDGSCLKGCSITNTLCKQTTVANIVISLIPQNPQNGRLLSVLR